jgi:Beta-lactamase
VARAAVLLLVLAIVGCGGGGAEPPLAERLQLTLDRGRAAQHIPGAAAAVVAGGRVVWVGASGLADVRRRVPVRRDTQFAIASVTKPFVAGLVCTSPPPAYSAWTTRSAAGCRAFRAPAGSRCASCSTRPRGSTTT